jgi:hypothetical protein
MKKTFKKPDLNAPRFRVPTMVKRHDTFCKRFRKKFTEHKGVTDQDIRKILATFNNNIKYHVVNERDGSELPEGLGYLFVGSCPAMVKKSNLNAAVSYKYNTQIKHNNFESDSFVAKIFYTNYATKYKFKMRELWAFKGSRDFTRSVSKSYRENWKIFVQVDSFMHIRKLYVKHLNKEYAIKHALKPDENYNEFDMN